MRSARTDGEHNDPIGLLAHVADDVNPYRRIEVNAVEESVIVRADPERLQQVMLNLLDNAVKNSPPSTPVEVDVSVEGDEVIVSVADHGSACRKRKWRRCSTSS